jgi:glutaredoxin 3
VELTGGRTVPRVFVDRVFLGGGDDMARLAASGELADLLTSKGLVAQA